MFMIMNVIVFIFTITVINANIIIVGYMFIVITTIINAGITIPISLKKRSVLCKLLLLQQLKVA